MKQLPELHLGTINLPPDTITKCINILAKRGAGKSYLAGVLEEELAKNDYPFVIIDPMGAHWGLRELYPIPIFGGDHGDVDIEVQDGPRLANLIVDLKKSILIDVSHWDQDTQREFVTEFVYELYQKNRKPLHVIIAHLQLLPRLHLIDAILTQPHVPVLEGEAHSFAAPFLLEDKGFCSGHN